MNAERWGSVVCWLAAIDKIFAILARYHTIFEGCFSCDTLNVSVQDMKSHIWSDNIARVMLSRSA